MNPDFVTEIRPANLPLKMSTNAGAKMLTVSGKVPGFGSVYFDPSQMANIFGFSHLVDLSKTSFITYNSRIEDAFLIH